MSTLVPATTEIFIRNDIAELAILSAAMDGIGLAHGLAPKSLYQLQIALDETVSNVIKYAFPEGGSHEIRVRITVRAAQVVIEIADDGVAFDPLDAPPPEKPLPGKRPRPGGVGIHITKQFMNKIEHVRINGRNYLTLTKQCDAGVQNP